MLTDGRSGPTTRPAFAKVMQVTSMRKEGPENLSSEDSYEGDSDIFNEDDKLCCVCNKWESKELKQCAAFVIAKWAK